MGNNGKVTKNITVQVEGKMYTLDLSNIKLLGRDLKVSAASSEKLYGKAVAELQSGITAADPVNRIIKVSGTSYYVDEYDGYTTTPDDGTNNAGWYVALDLSCVGVDAQDAERQWDRFERG